MKEILTIYCFLFLGYSTFAQVPTTGLVAEYLFSGGSYDDTNPNGYGPNNASAPTTVLTVADRFGNPNSAKDLAGIPYNQAGATHIILGSDAVLKPRYATISMWVNMDTISTNGWGYTFSPFILATNTLSPGSYMEAYSLYVVWSNRKLLTLTTRPSPRTQTLFYAGNVPDDSWHHYVMTYDDDTLKSYIDGVLIGAKYKGYNSANIFSNEDVRVGSSMNASNNRALDGTVDDIRIYNRVLNQSEVTALYEEEDPSPSLIYAELKKQLDGGATLLQDETLRFKFQQEYQTTSTNTNITYNIYDWTRGTPVATGTFSTVHGTNWVEIALPGGINTSEYHILEIEANKGQKYYLRFKPFTP